LSKNPEENEGEVDDLLGHRPLDRGKESESRRDHSNHAERHSTDGAFQRDPPHAPADVHQLVNLIQRRLQHDGIGRF